jgi:hypothetical protein
MTCPTTSRAVLTAVWLMIKARETWQVSFEYASRETLLRVLASDRYTPGHDGIDSRLSAAQN